MCEAWQIELLPSILLSLFTKRQKAWEDKIIIPKFCLPLPTVSLTRQRRGKNNFVTDPGERCDRPLAEGLSRCATVALHRFPVAVPEAGGPHTGMGTGKTPYPVVWSRSTARTLMLCSAQRLGLAHSWVELAVQTSLGEADNREGSGRMPDFWFALIYERQFRLNPFYQSLLLYPHLPIWRVPRHFRCILTAALWEWNYICIWTQRCQNGEICLLKTYLLL